MDETLQSQSVAPEWGDNYGAGWPGFQFTDNSFVSKGICWFTRWDRWPIPVSVSHTFIAIGPDTCVEAEGSGVVLGSLKERFNDPHTHVFFRKPIDYDDAMGKQIVDAAGTHLGEKYGYGLVIAKFLARTIPGKALDVITRGWWNRILCAALDFRHTADCDKVVAMALNASWRLAGRGVLSRPAREQTPQIIFEDQKIFTPWK